MTQTTTRTEAGGLENKEPREKLAASETGKTLLDDVKMQDFGKPIYNPDASNKMMKDLGLPSASDLLGKGDQSKTNGDNPNGKAEPISGKGGDDKSLKDMPIDTSNKGSYSEHGAISEKQHKQVEVQIKKEMNPEERGKYAKEEQSLKDYERRSMVWGMGTGGGKPPERPDTPMHDEVKRRAAEREKEATTKAKDEYGPLGKSMLDKEMREHDEATRKFYKSINWAGTGDWRKPPEAPPLVKEYYDKVRKQINARD